MDTACVATIAGCDHPNLRHLAGNLPYMQDIQWSRDGRSIWLIGQTAQGQGIYRLEAACDRGGDGCIPQPVEVRP
jgi:hypothetical protein